MNWWDMSIIGLPVCVCACDSSIHVTCIRLGKGSNKLPSWNILYVHFILFQTHKCTSVVTKLVQLWFICIRKITNCGFSFIPKFKSQNQKFAILVYVQLTDVCFQVKQWKQVMHSHVTQQLCDVTNAFVNPMSYHKTMS